MRCRSPVHRRTEDDGLVAGVTGRKATREIPVPQGHTSTACPPLSRGVIDLTADIAPDLVIDDGYGSVRPARRTMTVGTRPGQEESR